MRFRPIFDRVLIRREDSSLKKKASNAGLVLPDNIDDSYQSSQGTLIMCGDGCTEEIKALINKQVLFNRYSGDDITLDGENYLLATERDITLVEVDND